MLRNILFIAFLLLGIAPVNAQTQGQTQSPTISAPPVPLLWKVTQGQRTLYLLGSMHALKESDYPLDSSVYSALRAVDQVYLELSSESMTDPEQIAYMLRAGTLPMGRTLQQVLQLSTWQALGAFAAKRGIPLSSLQGMQPWMVASVVTTSQMKEQGFDASIGLDEHIRQRAIAAGKRVLGLETLREQIALFANWDAATQEQFLAEALDDTAHDGDALNRLYTHWRSGNADALAQDFLDDMRASSPEMYGQLLVQRNLAWMPVLLAYLSQPGQGQALVVVGAGHLVGPDGLVQLMRVALDKPGHPAVTSLAPMP